MRTTAASHRWGRDKRGRAGATGRGKERERKKEESGRDGEKRKEKRKEGKERENITLVGEKEKEGGRFSSGRIKPNQEFGQMRPLLNIHYTDISMWTLT